VIRALILLAAATADSAGAPPQPEVVCDLTPVLSGHFEGSRFVREELSGSPAKTVRFTFRDIDPKAGTARLNVEPDTFDQPVAVSVESGAISYLQEQPGVGKMVVATQTKPTDQGWPATMSQHGWTAEGSLFIRTATGMCRMRARRAQP